MSRCRRSRSRCSERGLGPPLRPTEPLGRRGDQVEWTPARSRSADGCYVESQTIYNQYGSKAELFRAVIVASAHRVAELQIAVVTECLAAIDDAAGLQAGLVAFARAWGASDPRSARHFALVRQVRADVDHVPSETLQAWQEAGPRRVHAEIARHLQRIAEIGLLEFDDAATATDHLIALATASTDTLQLRPAAEHEPDGLHQAEAAIHTFLRGLSRP